MILRSGREVVRLNLRDPTNTIRLAVIPITCISGITRSYCIPMHKAHFEEINQQSEAIPKGRHESLPVRMLKHAAVLPRGYILVLRHDGVSGHREQEGDHVEM